MFTSSLTWAGCFIFGLSGHSGLLHIFKSSQLANPPLTTYLLAPTYYTALRSQVLSRPASFLSDVFNERHFLGRARSGHVFPVDGLRSSQLVFSFSTAPLNHLELYLHFYMLDTSHLIQTFEEACQRLRADMIWCGSPKMRKNRQFHKLYAHDKAGSEFWFFIWKYESHQITTLHLRCTNCEISILKTLFNATYITPPQNHNRNHFGPLESVFSAIATYIVQIIMQFSQNPLMAQFRNLGNWGFWMYCGSSCIAPVILLEKVPSALHLHHTVPKPNSTPKPVWDIIVFGDSFRRCYLRLRRHYLFFLGS